MSSHGHTDILQHFGCLDELIQVIYQGFYRFVVLSNVDEQNWTIHLGLMGPEGRWWRGVWDSDSVVKSKLSPKLLDTFAERAAEAFINGELCVDDWRPDQGAPIKLTLGPTSKHPLHINFTELTTQEAASHATKLFFDMALQSRPHGCRLNALSNSLPLAAAVAPSSSGSKEQDEIKTLKAELAKIQKLPEPTLKPAPSRPLKGASLANPNKKARKYQALEFESDDE